MSTNWYPDTLKVNNSFAVLLSEADWSEVSDREKSWLTRVLIEEIITKAGIKEKREVLMTLFNCLVEFDPSTMEENVPSWADEIIQSYYDTDVIPFATSKE
jgi:hypothetical protein